MTDEKLKSYADRIDRLEEEKKGLTGDVRDIYTEVSSAGYNAKALRKVLAERRKKTDDELAADIELYKAALGISSYRAVSAALGVSKSKLQRLVPKSSRGTVPHDSDGIVLEGEGCGPLASHPGSVSQIGGDRLAPPAPTGEPTGHSLVRPQHAKPTTADTTGEGDRLRCPPNLEGAYVAKQVTAAPTVEMGHPPSEADDALDLPPFLDRRPQVSA